MNTVRGSRILLVLLMTLVLSWVLPHYYWKAFDISIRPPRVSYSPITDDFLFIRPETKSVRYTDREGKEYTREEYERLLPLANYRQLAASGAMPDSLRGVLIDLKTVALNNIFLRIMPEDIGMPQIPLYPLFESQSGRVRIEMPQEFFRITDRCEFIDAATNTIREELSREFTDSLRAHGFAFPARSIAGNPTTRKPFDEGYFVVDAAGAVFHLKMVRGKPACVATGIPSTPAVRAIVVSEMMLREFYGVLIAEDNSVSLISYDGYTLITLPLRRYDAARCALFIGGDLFFRTITVQGDGWLETVVTDRTYKVVDTYRAEWPTRDVLPAGIWASRLFPVALHLQDDNSVFVDFYTEGPTADALWGIAGSLLLLVGSLLLRRRHLRAHLFDILLVACTGVFGLIAVHLIPPPEE